MGDIFSTPSNKSECKTNHSELIETQAECLSKWSNGLILKSGCANTVDQCIQKFPNNLMTIDSCDIQDKGLLFGMNCSLLLGEQSCNNNYSVIQNSELAYQCIWDATSSACKSFDNDLPNQATICRIPIDQQ